MQAVIVGVVEDVACQNADTVAEAVVLALGVAFQPDSPFHVQHFEHSAQVLVVVSDVFAAAMTVKIHEQWAMKESEGAMIQPEKKMVTEVGKPAQKMIRAADPEFEHASLMH